MIKSIDAGPSKKSITNLYFLDIFKQSLLEENIAINNNEYRFFVKEVFFCTVAPIPLHWKQKSNFGMPSKNTSNNVYYVVGLAAYPSARGTVGNFFFFQLSYHTQLLMI